MENPKHIAFSHGRVAYNHDYRISLADNVSKDLVEYNVELENILNGQTAEHYINQKMQPVIDEFNSRQKREDRKINEAYCDYWKNNSKLNRGKTKLVQEVVLSAGNRDLVGREFYRQLRELHEQGKKEEIEQLKESFVNYYKESLEQFKDKYKHLEVLYAVIHFDEELGTPHLHIAYIGIGEDYKQGLSKQISVSNALKCDGVDRVEKRNLGKEGYQLSRFYNQVKEEILIPLSLDIDFPGWTDLSDKSSQTIEKHPHFEQEVYKYVREEVEAEYKEVYEDLSALKNKRNEQQQIVTSTDKVITEINDRRNKLYLELREQVEQLKDVEEKTDFLNVIDNLKGQIKEEDIPYETKPEALFSKKKLYLVPENDLESMLLNLNITEGFKEKFKELENRTKELDEKENNLIEDIGRLNYRKSEFSSKEQELKKERRAIEEEKKQLLELIETRAKELFSKFLNQYPEIKQLFDKYLEQTKKIRRYVSIDIDR